MEKDLKLTEKLLKKLDAWKKCTNTIRSSITECDSYAVQTKKKQLNIIKIITKRN